MSLPRKTYSSVLPLFQPVSFIQVFQTSITSYLLALFFFAFAFNMPDLWIAKYTFLTLVWIISLLLIIGAFMPTHKVYPKLTSVSASSAKQITFSSYPFFVRFSSYAFSIASFSLSLYTLYTYKAHTTLWIASLMLLLFYTRVLPRASKQLDDLVTYLIAKHPDELAAKTTPAPKTDLF